MLFCGIDIGTTNTKAIVIDEDAKPRGKVHLSGAINTRNGTFSAELWYNHFCQILEEFNSQGLMSDEKVFCSITSQGGSFTLLDGKYKPVSKVHSWMENSSEESAENMENILGKEPYYHKTGWQPDRWLTACKLKDLVTQGLIKNVKHIATVPDFIQARLTGDFVTDITNAQVTGICDYKDKRWSPNILDWIGIGQDFMPKIIAELKVIKEDVSTPVGRISLVTSSHDQYAATFAAGLQPDKSIMLGTGTAWVINGKSTEPVIDKNYLVHPGRDLLPNQFGFIVGQGAFGAGFEKLLTNLKLSKQDLPRIESTFAPANLPKEPLKFDFNNGTIEGDFDPATSVRRYMEATASSVAYVLKKIQPKAEKIIMTGGATQSAYWPQALANICNVSIETIDMPEFTAYGAALFAKAAVTGNSTKSLNDLFESKTYFPANSVYFKDWFETCQLSLFEQ